MPLSCAAHRAEGVSDDLTLDALACIRAATTVDTTAMGIVLSAQCQACLTCRVSELAALFIDQLADQLGTTPAGWLATVTDGVLQLLADGPTSVG